jgi:hypothetical protein
MTAFSLSDAICAYYESEALPIPATILFILVFLSDEALIGVHFGHTDDTLTFGTDLWCEPVTDSIYEGLRVELELDFGFEYVPLNTMREAVGIASRFHSYVMGGAA